MRSQKYLFFIASVCFICSFTMIGKAQKTSNELSLGKKAKGAFETRKTLKKPSLKKLEAKQKLRELTNIELKARAGSASALSVKGILSYAGSSIEQPFEPSRPNPENRAVSPNTSMAGSIAARYRLTPRSSLGFGTGLSAFTPFHGVKDVDLNDPRVTYDYFRVMNNWQSYSSISGFYTTYELYKDAGQVGSINLTQNLKYQIGKSRLAFGIGGSLSWFFFDRDFRQSDPNVSQYMLTIFPGFDYKVSDRWQLKTSWAQSFANLRRFDTLSKINDFRVTQRLGFSVAVYSIYVNPYIEFYPEDFDSETATLSFSTIFNIF